MTPFVTARIAQAIKHPDDLWARTYAEDMDSMARALAEAEQQVEELTRENVDLMQAESLARLDTKIAKQREAALVEAGGHKGECGAGLDTTRGPDPRDWVAPCDCGWDDAVAASRAARGP